MVYIYKEAVNKMNKNDIDNWQSDLYLKVNSISKTLVDEYDFKNLVTIFKDNIDGELWFEIPFAYVPYFQDKINN